MLVLSVEEVALMLVGMGSMPDSIDEALGHVEGWIEHMRAGEIPCGRTIADGVPASSRADDVRSQQGAILVLSVDEVSLMLTEMESLPDSENEGRERIEAWVAQLRNLEIPCGRTINDAPAELCEL